MRGRGRARYRTGSPRDPDHRRRRFLREVRDPSGGCCLDVLGPGRGVQLAAHIDGLPDVDAGGVDGDWLGN